VRNLWTREELDILLKHRFLPQKKVKTQIIQAIFGFESRILKHQDLSKIRSSWLLNCIWEWIWQDLAWDCPAL